MICEEKQYIDIHIPKCGGTSRVEAFRELGLLVGPDHLRHAMAKELRYGKDHLKRPWDDYYSIAVFRHPYDLYVSLYHYRRDRLEEENYHNIPEHVSFEQWMMEHVADPRQVLPEELTDCLCFIEGQQGEILVDDIFTLDQIDEAWEKVCHHIGMKIDLPRTNTTEHKPARSYFEGKNHLKSIVWGNCWRALPVFNWEI